MLSGCLTVDYKIYFIDLNRDKTGTITIHYANICNTNDSVNIKQMTDEEACSELFDTNFHKSIQVYEFQDLKMKSKRLFEKEAQLWGEIVFEFDSLSQIGLFQYDKKSPYVFLHENLYEFASLMATNGKLVDLHFGRMIFWDKKTKHFEIKIKTLFANDETSSSLLYLWQNN